MINAWLDLPTAVLFAALITFYALTGALISWACVRSPLRAKIQTVTGVVAPFFGAVSVLFALLTGFLANDVGDRNRQAWRAVHTESSAAMSVHTLSVASASDMAAIRVDEEIRRYIVRLAAASRSAPELALGASPRAEVMLMQAAKAQATFEDRQFVTPDDVKALLAPAFRHRLILRPEAEVAGQTADTVLADIASQVTPPR